MSSGSSSRPPRSGGDSRGSGRPPSSGSGKPAGGRSSGKSSGRPPGKSSGKPGERKYSGRSDERGDKRSGGRPSGRSDGRRPTGRPGSRSDADRSDSRRSDGGRSSKPLTEADRRSMAVKARRAPRAPVDPDLERQKIESRTTEQWIDEGSVRREATEAARRAGGEDTGEPTRRPSRPLDPEVAAELVGALGAQRGARLTDRLAQASEALDRERFQEARRIALAVAKEAPSVAAAHEIAGLSNYRLGRYKQAVASLEIAQDLHANPALLPVIADCHRAQGRWTAVELVWTELKSASPSHDVMAEGRIVAAGARADQGDLRGALEMMEPAKKRPKVVRDFHLRQWYVLADLYDRVGDPISARRWFASIAEFDHEFADVDARLRSLGR